MCKTTQNIKTFNFLEQTCPARRTGFQVSTHAFVLKCLVIKANQNNNKVEFKKTKTVLTLYTTDTINVDWVSGQAKASVGGLVTVGVAEHAATAVLAGIANVKSAVGI
jgi:hypothetical protein